MLKYKQNFLLRQYAVKQKTRAKILLVIMLIDIFIIPSMRLAAHAWNQQDSTTETLQEQDLHTILTSSEPLVILGTSYKALIEQEHSLFTLTALETALKNIDFSKLTPAEYAQLSTQQIN